MSSPASFQLSAKSTPEIITSMDHMEDESGRLPPPMLSAHSLGCDTGSPSSQRTPDSARRSMHLKMEGDSGQRSSFSEKKNPSNGTPPIPIRNTTINSFAGENHTNVANSVRTSTTPPHLKPRPKILSDLKRSLSHSNLHNIFHRNQRHHQTASNTHPAHMASVIDSGTGSPLADSPDLQSLLSSHPSKTTRPNLPAVNRALQSLRSDADTGASSHHEQTTEYLASLTVLATTLTAAQASSRKALSRAMLARDAGRYEVCRALCLGILQEDEWHADVEMRVYACAILSTLASKGMSVAFLVEGTKLVEEACRDGAVGAEDGGEGAIDGVLRDKLLVLLAMTKEGAVKRDGGMEVEQVKQLAAKVKGLDDLRPGTDSELVRQNVGKLKVPEDGGGGNGTVTPRLSKILLWQSWR